GRAWPTPSGRCRPCCAAGERRTALELLNYFPSWRLAISLSTACRSSREWRSRGLLSQTVEAESLVSSTAVDKCPLSSFTFSFTVAEKPCWFQNRSKCSTGVRPAIRRVAAKTPNQMEKPVQTRNFSRAHMLTSYLVLQPR